MIAKPIVIGLIDPSEIRQTATRLAGYAKSCSIAWLRALNIPTLDGLIIDSWDHSTQKSVSSFSAKYNTHTLLLRIDRKDQRWTDRRGGYLVEVDKVSELWKELSLESFIPILLESSSPYSNYCALSGVLSTSEGHLIIEVIGRGFDASDILRSDLAPHERWQGAIAGRTGLWHFVDPPKRTFTIGQNDYSSSVHERLAKIGAGLVNPAFPRTALGMVSGEHLREEAVRFLEGTRQRWLLEAHDYSPLSPRVVEQFAGMVLELKNGLDRHAIQLGSLTAAASVLADGRMVFWDFFPIKQQEICKLWQ